MLNQLFWPKQRLLYHSAGIWYNLLRGLSKVAVILNVSLVIHFLYRSLSKCAVWKIDLTPSWKIKLDENVPLWGNFLLFMSRFNLGITFPRDSNQTTVLCLVGVCHLFHFWLHPETGLSVHVQPRWNNAWLCRSHSLLLQCHWLWARHRPSRANAFGLQGRNVQVGFHLPVKCTPVWNSFCCRVFFVPMPNSAIYS